MGSGAKPTCFVVMGFGEKTDPNSNKTFNLDKSYRILIKPAVEAAGFQCERADEIQHAGLIDVPMYDRLLNADLVVADLSCWNVNAFFELGVRYALKPRATVVIAESGFRHPFDTGHIAVRSYEHLGKGIDAEEAERFRKQLTEACKAARESISVDSPVYAFLHALEPPRVPAPMWPGALRPGGPVAAAGPAAAATRMPTEPGEKAAAAPEATARPMAEMMEAATEARARNDWAAMHDILQQVHAARSAHSDPFLVQQLALATYKAKLPDPETALREARHCLEEIDPKNSVDPETLGLWGAIHKGLWNLQHLPMTERQAALDEAILGYEKGFVVSSDYYTGINLAFLLDVRAARGDGEAALADRVQAGRVRAKVAEICTRLLEQPSRGESEAAKREARYWILATLAEAHLGMGDEAEANARFEQAKKVAPEAWMIESTRHQIDSLRTLRRARGPSG
jgi:tetratricopeptide (TPR) repeat protein